MKGNRKMNDDLLTLRLEGSNKEPEISLVGYGGRAYLWAGDRNDCTGHRGGREELRKFFRDALFRLRGLPNKKFNPTKRRSDERD
jgi:hypothetical protein